MKRLIRPSLRGSWGLIFGAALGPAIILSERDAQGRFWLWCLLSLVFVAIFLYRLSLVYTITDDSLTAGSWWGLGRVETVTLSAVDRAEVLKGLVQTMAGCAHVHVHSCLSSEGSITIISQPRAESLASEIETLSRQAYKNQRGQSEEQVAEDA